ncbi:PREDICTED: uncharacterized protein LOC109326379 [Lupinus angustifolius]|uniref:uncharacterized protein LOC109326379 n=1 Tax=Lupinus angustifolius TaxID=3871 RepID=UPI00092E2A46|nr:PREDICTED: uncharacterized protein LOC109326379 [Lupinus angustifolius]
MIHGYQSNILLRSNSFLLSLWLLQESLLYPAPWLEREREGDKVRYLNEVKSAGGSSDAPQGGGFDGGGLETKLRR